MTESKTNLQTILLARLRDEFQVDTSDAENLSGPLLDQWLSQAENDLFLNLCAGAREGA